MNQKPLLHENPAIGRETNAWSSSGLQLDISNEPQDHKRTTASYAMDAKVPVLSSTRLPYEPSASLTLKSSSIEMTGAKANIQAAKPPAVHGGSKIPPQLFIGPILNHAVSTSSPFANPREPLTLTDIRSVKANTHISPSNTSKQKSLTKDSSGSQFVTRDPQFQTSSNESMFLNHTSPIRPPTESRREESQTFRSPTLPTEVTFPSKFPTLHSVDHPQHVPHLQTFSKVLEPQLDNSASVSTIKPPQLQTEVPQSASTLHQSVTSYHNPPVEKIPMKTEGQDRISQTPTSSAPHMYPRPQTLIQKSKLRTQTTQWEQTPTPITRLTSASRSDQKLNLGEGFQKHTSKTISETITSTQAYIPSTSPSILASSRQLSAAVPVSSFASPRTKSLSMSTVQSFSSPISKAQTAARLPNLPTPSPISTPPYITPAPLPVPASSTLPPLSLSESSAHTLSISVSSSAPKSSRSSVASSYASLFPSFTISPSISSIDSASSLSSFSSNSTPSPSSSSQESASSFLASPPSPNFAKTTSRHRQPSSVSHQSQKHHVTPTLPTLTSQPPINKLLIHVTSLELDPKPNVPTPGILHSPPKVHPNFDQNLKANLDKKAKPNPTQIDNSLKDPSITPVIPVMEGKYPDIIPRNSTWVLGMLLGCSACLGMIAVVGLRYMYHQVCSKRTGVTLNDREREFGGGERGLIHVQECGDLVRVRRITDNSFVFLAEYDILASAGD